MRQEIFLLLQSAAGGALILAGCDLLCILRRLFRRSSLAVSAEDLGYWLAAAVFLSGRLYQANRGKLRFFLLLGLALGMYLYHRTIRSYFVEGCAAVLEIPVNFVKKIRNMLLFWIKRCRIYVCVSMRKRYARNKWFHPPGSRKQSEKDKKKILKNQDSK